MRTYLRASYKAVIMAFLSFCSCSYLPEGSPSLDYEETADYIVLKSSNPDNSKAGIIFYPGGLVDPHAYISVLEDFLVTDNRTIIILKVTSNLAIWNSQKASKLLKQFPNIEQWVLGGHSLGGSTACIDLFENPDQFDGLFLMAAYSVNDLSDSDIPVLSITGSEDGVLDMSNFNENKKNLPEGTAITSPFELNYGSTNGQTIYYEIQGGNHAQFGNFGFQDGDGTATISAEEQQNQVNEMLREFLFVNNL